MQDHSIKVLKHHMTENNGLFGQAATPPTPFGCRRLGLNIPLDEVVNAYRSIQRPDDERVNPANIAAYERGRRQFKDRTELLLDGALSVIYLRRTWRNDEALALIERLRKGDLP
jgi:hypothetical protein